MLIYSLLIFKHSLTSDSIRFFKESAILVKPEVQLFVMSQVQQHY